MNTARLLVIAFLLPFLAPNAVRADDVDALVQAHLKDRHIPGLSLAVVKAGKVILDKGYGLANVEHDVPAKPETVYQSGSMGKQFTATAVMMLVEEGKLGLDDKIGKYLDGTPMAWDEITVRHLLTHTSGIKTYSRTDLDHRKDYTEAELLKKAASFPVDFAPGEKWKYSNTGYVLLGIIIRKASGEFYGDFLSRRVFKPLGMETARIISEKDIVPNRATGYSLIQGQLKNQEWVSPSLNTTADGSLYLTVLDMAKWDAALYTEKLLKKTSLDQMWTPVKTKDGKTNPYGFGWGVAELKGRKVVEHNGIWQGFAAAIVRYPVDKVTVIVMTNLTQGSPGKVAREIADLYLEKSADGDETVDLPRTLCY
jgi:CubicO group peptidase (beta-lactamase class C family)